MRWSKQTPRKRIKAKEPAAADITVRRRKRRPARSSEQTVPDKMRRP